jgi:hypothetical protein
MHEPYRKIPSLISMATTTIQRASRHLNVINVTSRNQWSPRRSHAPHHMLRTWATCCQALGQQTTHHHTYRMLIRRNQVPWPVLLTLLGHYRRRRRLQPTAQNGTMGTRKCLVMELTLYRLKQMALGHHLSRILRVISRI